MTAIERAMEMVRTSSRHDVVPAHIVLNVLAELSAAVEAMRCEMARLGIRAPGAALPQDEAAGARLEELSKRQRQVLAGIMRGCPNKIIAWELGLSVRTVEAYRAQLFERLGARNAVEAVRLALAAGLAGDEGLGSAG